MPIIDIRDLLIKECIGEKVYYYPNPGNGGDSLIALATYQTFDRIDIEYETIDMDRDFDSKAKTVIYSGGGNLVKRGRNAARFISKHHKSAKKLILLPHTVEANKVLLGQLGVNVHLVARERRTYDYLVLHAKGANVYLAHDMAFSLDIKKVFSDGSSGVISDVIRYFKGLFAGKGRSTMPARSSKRLLAMFLVLLHRLKQVRRHGQVDVLNAFRCDIEGRDFVKPSNNIDLSAVFTFGTHSRKSVQTTVYELLKYMEQYEVVNTDRLHICIGSALLGKTVNFYANDYFKCEEVFKLSLVNFQNVKWKGNEVPSISQ